MCLHPTACQHRRICGRPDQGFIYLRGNFFPRGQNQGRKHGTILRKDENHIWLGAQITPYFGCQGYRLSQERHFVQVHQMNGTSQLAVQFGLLRGVGLEPPPSSPAVWYRGPGTGVVAPVPARLGSPAGGGLTPPPPVCLTYPTHARGAVAMPGALRGGSLTRRSCSGWWLGTVAVVKGMKGKRWLCQKFAGV